MADVAGGNGQEAAGENLASVRHEKEPLAVVDAGLALNVARASAGRGRANPRLLALLRGVAPVVLRLSRLDVERRAQASTVEELEDLLVFLRGEVVRKLRAAGHNQEEHAPQPGSLLFHQIRHLAQLA